MYVPCVRDSAVCSAFPVAAALFSRPCVRDLVHSDVGGCSTFSYLSLPSFFGLMVAPWDLTPLYF